MDSLKKVNKGCRGIGRLLWLKAFRSVNVDSHYLKDREVLRRTFTFDIRDEVSEPKEEVSKTKLVATTITLNGFDERYALGAHKTLEGIATSLLEHCLWYFIRDEGVSQITIFDENESVDLDAVFDDHMHSSSAKESIQVKGENFELTHIKVRASKNKAHSIGYCAAGRLVKEEGLKGKIPGLYSSITDDIGEFTYMGYLTGEFLNNRVTHQRTSFDIEDATKDIFSDIDVSYDDIRNQVIPCIEKFLDESLEAARSDSAKRIEEFVSKVAPKYRPMMEYIPSEKLDVDPNSSEKDLDLILHQEVFFVEQKLLAVGHEMMNPKAGESEGDYLSRIDKYLQQVSALKQSDLANYVTHRKVVIDLLRSASNQNDDGTFAREDLIHNVIVPMGTTSDELKFRRQNLWLIDERLAFHNYLASDIPLTSNPTTNNKTTKKPDVAILNVFDNPILVGEDNVSNASLTVIEIKRPMRPDFKAGMDEKTDPITQSLNYLKRLREGSATRNGRAIPKADEIPGFVYVLADFTDHLIECCQFHRLQRTFDGMGYFGYHPDKAYNAYIQVMSFDGIVQSATERNKAFFDTLGLPSNN